MIRALAFVPSVLVSATVLSGAASAQQTWYVDVDGVPPGDGNSVSPYTSIQYAFDRPTTQNGDTFLVAPGVYAENVNYKHKFVDVRATDGPLQTKIVGNVVIQNLGLLIPALEGFWVAGNVTMPGGSIARCVVQGGGVDYYDSISIRNCTIVGCSVGVEEAFFNATFGSTIENTLFFGNGTDLNIDQQNLAHGSSVRYCFWKTGDVGAYGTTGTPSASAPGLWNAGASDFHLAPLSACIDSGDPAQFDLDGSRVDIGAIPYDASYAATPTTYCTPKVNSQGCSPTVSWSGTPSLTGADDFVLTASDALNKKVGKYIWSAKPNAAPFLGGTLCIKLPFVRGPHLTSGGSASGTDCTGAYAWHFSQAYMASKGVTAGQIVYAQAWGRDPGFADPNNSQLSDAIVFQVAP